MKLSEIKVKCAHCEAVTTLNDMGIGWEENEDEPLEYHCNCCYSFGKLMDLEVAE